MGDTYNGPLKSLTVLDLTRVRSGPTAVRQLADWGANVIKIEAPENLDKAKGMGGARTGPDYQNIHRNKRSITLNLKSPEGRSVFLRLAKAADVIVENFRPNVKHRLGIPYDKLKSINKKIVLLSISGFGQDGPYAQRPGFDQVAQGMGGLMSITGLPDQGPVRAGIPIADLAAGMFGAIGVLIALLERERSGEGQWVQSSLLHSMISMLDFQAARYTMTGDVPSQAGNDHPTSIPTGVFQASDGYINIAASGEQIWKRLCEALGDLEMYSDPDFSSGKLRSLNRNAVNTRIQAHVRRKTCEEWIDLLSSAGIPCGPIYSIDQVFADEQVNHIEMRHPVKHPTLGHFDIIAQAIRMNRYQPRTGMPTPDRGQHTREVLNEFGFTDEEVKSLYGREII